MYKKLIILGTWYLFLTACATTYRNPNLQLSEEGDYYSALEKYSEKKQVYNGLYATMEFTASLLNTPVQRLQVDQNARIYQWDSDKYSSEKSKVESNLAKQTEVFLSFFVPDKRNDELNKPKTQWKIFLDANGKRFEGKAEKVKVPLSETTALYPMHNRWSTPYKIIFNVPTSQIESGPSKLTLTGPVGSASVDFKAVELNYR